MRQVLEKVVAHLLVVGVVIMWAWQDLLETPVKPALRSAAVVCPDGSTIPPTAGAPLLLAGGTAGEGLHWPHGTPVPLPLHSPPLEQGCAGGRASKVHCCCQCHLVTRALPGC